MLEGNIRTPCIIRWPSNIPGGRVSNQIIAIIDFFPTLARIAGGKIPTDRPIDCVDQLDFFMGRQEKSNREHVLLFLGQKLMAVKWRNYKIHLDGLDRVDRRDLAVRYLNDRKLRVSNIAWLPGFRSKRTLPRISHISNEASPH